MGAVTTFGATAITAEMNDIQAQAAAFQAGAQSPPFLASIAFFSLFTALFTFMLLIAALRTNVMFVGAFFTLALAFTFFAVSRFLGANGDMVGYENWQVVSLVVPSLPLRALNSVGAQIDLVGVLAARWYVYGWLAANALHRQQAQRASQPQSSGGTSSLWRYWRLWISRSICRCLI